MSKIGNYLVGKIEATSSAAYNESLEKVDSVKQINDYKIDDVLKMSSSQYSEYFYGWMAENTNDQGVGYEGFPND